MLYTPIIEDEKSRSDIYSRLLKDRIILCYGEITDELAAVVTAQLLYLSSVDSKKDINLYINSPGGSISAGLSIYDTMKLIQPDVSTTALGTAASMGSFLFSAGTKGKRLITPNAQVLIHQPLLSGGLSGQASDIEIHTNHLLQTKKKMNKYLSEFSGQSLEWIQAHTDRDYYMDAEKTVEYGFADKIIGQ